MKSKFRSYDLAVEFYHLTRTLKLESHLRDQLLRAASSIVLNLAEGSGRRTKKDQTRFFYMAFGSIRESQAIIDLARDQGEATLILDALAASVYKLIKNCLGA